MQNACISQKFFVPLCRNCACKASNVLTNLSDSEYERT